MFTETTLGEVLDFYNGRAIKPGGTGRFPAYGSNGLIGGSDEYRYEHGIVIGRVGAYCGSVAYCLGKFWASDNTIVVKPKLSGDSTRFFAYLLLEMNLHRHAGGSAQPLVTQSTLKAVSVKVPDAVTQRHIASILSAYDDLIENNTRRIAILEEMARRLYEEWFVRFRFPGHEGVPMVESELGLVPQGWEQKKVNDIVLRLPSGVVYKQADVSPEGTVPVIDQSTSELLGFHENAPAHKAFATSPVVIFGDHTCKMQLMVTPFSLGPNTVPFVANELAVHYVFWVVRGLIKTQEYKRHWSDLMKKSIITAPVAVAQLFAEQVQSMAEFSELLKRKNRNLRTTRDLLLPKLISGELDVSTLPEAQAETT